MYDDNTPKRGYRTSKWSYKVVSHGEDGPIYSAEPRSDDEERLVTFIAIVCIGVSLVALLFLAG